MMNAYLHHARYFGGPCDGMVVVATRQSGDDKWSMPVATTNGQADSGGRSTTEIYQAVYKLSRTRHLIEHGSPTIRYEYEFVGLEVVAPVTRSAVAPWLAFVKSRVERLFQPNLWLPLPEGRPKRPGQAGRLLTCPGRGLGLNSNRATVAEPTGSRGCTAYLNTFQRESCAKR
jgi:hypothetical protein